MKVCICCSRAFWSFLKAHWKHLVSFAGSHENKLVASTGINSFKMKLPIPLLVWRSVNYCRHQMLRLERCSRRRCRCFMIINTAAAVAVAAANTLTSLLGLYVILSPAMIVTTFKPRPLSAGRSGVVSDLLRPADPRRTHPGHTADTSSDNGHEPGLSGGRSGVVLRTRPSSEHHISYDEKKRELKGDRWDDVMW